jgi:hypothetical protein
VVVNNSIKVGPLVFLLQMFVITESIMKFPMFMDEIFCACRVLCTHFGSKSKCMGFV